MDYDKLCGLAISRLSLTVNEFYDLTPVEFYQALESTKEYEIAKLERDHKSNYSLARFIIMWVWNAQGRKFKQVLTDPKKMMRFDWEEEDKNEPQTIEQMRNQMKSIANYFKRKLK